MKENAQQPSPDYETVSRLAALAASDILRSIQDALRQLGDSHLIRASVDSWRIKSEQSLMRKAGERQWATLAEAIDKAPDLLGFRVVCHNLQDVERMAALVSEALGRQGLFVQKSDFVKEPKADGYRAIHLLFRYQVKMASAEANLGCEIQVRSLLQNSWAQLSRVDIYTPAVPIGAALTKKMLQLSSQLAKADATADSIRARLARPRRGRRSAGEESLSPPAIAFVYRQRYKEDPPEYLIAWVLNNYQGTGVRCDGIAAALRDEEFQKKLRDAYERHVKWEAENQQVFRCVVHSVADGQDSAIRLAARDGRQEWQDIERTARNEMRSSLPDDPESLLSRYIDPKEDDLAGDIEEIASSVGGNRTCVRCGTTIVDPEEFADSVVSHYRLRGKRADSIREDMIQAVNSSGVDVGGWNSSDLCSYCDHVMSKDD